MLQIPSNILQAFFGHLTKLKANNLNDLAKKHSTKISKNSRNHQLQKKTWVANTVFETGIFYSLTVELQGKYLKWYNIEDLLSLS